MICANELCKKEHTNNVFCSPECYNTAIQLVDVVEEEPIIRDGKGGAIAVDR